LQQIYFIKNHDLLIAHRPIANSFSDATPFTFDRYTIRSNQDEIPGIAKFYWQKIASLTLEQKLCDANQAIKILDKEHPEFIK